MSKRANQRSNQVAAARRAGVSMPTVIAVAVGLVLAVAVIGGILLAGGGDESAAESGAPIPVTPASTDYPTTLEDGVVIAGGPAPRVLDVWEDPLCPACQVFTERAGEPVARAVAEGRLQARYHMVNLLEEASSPAGYSSLAGNAMMCAAENGVFPGVHSSLYAAQPAERGPGYTTEQLVGLGTALGAGPGYAECVTSGRHVATVAQNYQQATTNPAVAQDGRFGTPTLLLDGRRQEGGSTELDALLGGG